MHSQLEGRNREIISQGHPQLQSKFKTSSQLHWLAWLHTQTLPKKKKIIFFEDSIISQTRVMHTFHPRTWEAEAGKSMWFTELVQDSQCYTGKTLSQKTKFQLFISDISMVTGQYMPQTLDHLVLWDTDTLSSHLVHQEQ